MESQYFSDLFSFPYNSCRTSHDDSYSIIGFLAMIHSFSLHLSAMDHLVHILSFSGSVPYSPSILGASCFCDDSTISRNAVLKSSGHKYLTSSVHLGFTFDKLLPFQFERIHKQTQSILSVHRHSYNVYSPFPPIFVSG